MYGSIDGVVRVGVVVAGIVVEAWRAVAVGLPMVMVVDSVGTAVMRAAMPTRKAGRMLNFITLRM